MALTLGELAEGIGAELRGDPHARIHAVNTLEAAGEGELSFLTQGKYRKALQSTAATAVIVPEAEAEHCPVAALVVDNPHAAFARAATLLYPVERPAPGIHASAVVPDSCVLGERVHVGPHCTLGENVVLGDDCVIGPGSVIEKGVRIGAGGRLLANVTILADCRIGERVLIHPGAVIGSDGFGQADDNGRWLKIPQVGRVIIGDDVEIGANVCIDRGAIADTVIEDGVKLDNLVHIAHNVRIGADTVIAALSGIAGSTTLGRHCMLGGEVGIVGHITIADNVVLTGRADVRQSIREPGVYASGTPLEPVREWHRNQARFRQLDEMARQLKKLEKRLAEIEGKG
ncbi:MAG TPA: UDP-3-O-(3-hydroxymyristoyl)glucosamine N-acyltransferase [Gammaproteobacteria bacterium]|nr:UDP-3-O-(3-hydroxymyristoyl)glucosamine N-acyltransferase [Gammaproteobacteria bacterium]